MIFPRFITVLAIFLVLNHSYAGWITYKSFSNTIPSYTYEINLNAGDTIRGVLSWPNNQDLDLYFYQNGVNLLAR